MANAPSSKPPSQAVPNSEAVETASKPASKPASNTKPTFQALSAKPASRSGSRKPASKVCPLSLIPCPYLSRRCMGYYPFFLPPWLYHATNYILSLRLMVNMLLVLVWKSMFPSPKNLSLLQRGLVHRSLAQRSPSLHRRNVLRRRFVFLAFIFLSLLILPYVDRLNTTFTWLYAFELSPSLSLRR